ncbi:MAG: hypothetical protein GYB35_14905 [Algicola sp.]|nr:hypothetical protein [Algicola sp.]
MNKVEEVKQLLFKQLKYGLNHEEILEKLVDRIWKRLQTVNKYNKITPEIIKEFSEIKDLPIPHKLKPYSSINWFEKYSERNGLEIDLGKDRLSYLDNKSEKLNNYKTPMDFEYGLLFYSIQKYNEALSHLHSYVFSLKSNALFIDFKNLELEEIDSVSKKTTVGNFNLDKKRVAHLFRILMEENLIIFDDNNEKSNDLKMKKFVENNFTFQNTSGGRIPIKTFNREYSEVCSSLSANVSKHKAFIDDLINILKQRKNRLRD